MIHWILAFTLIAHCVYGIIYVILNHKKLNGWLVVLFIALMIPVSGGLWVEWFRLKPIPLILNPSYFLLVGPCLKFYFDYLINDPERTKSKAFIHLVPFLIFNILFSFFVRPPIQPEHAHAPRPDGIAFSTFSFNTVLILSFVGYSLAILRQVIKNIKRADDYYTEHSQRTTLTWIVYLMAGFTILFVSVPLVEFLFRELKPGVYPKGLHQIVLIAFAYGLTTFAFKQPLLYREAPKLKENPKKPSYGKTGLKDNQKPGYLKKLTEYIKDHQPYLNPTLRIMDLSEALEIPPHQLSQLINEAYKKNFFQYINELRISHAITLIKAPEFQHAKILQIAYESGFNSKSAFNSAFKEVTDNTPSQFKKRTFDA